MRRGQVFQTDPVVNSLPWNEQPPLVYVTGKHTAIDENGHPVDCSDTSKWEDRGTIKEKDLINIENKAK